MASFNKLILIGNLTADPEVKQTQTGTSVCSFNIAVNRKYAKEGEQNVDFITVVAWRERAEFVGKFFKKGKPILVCGQLQSRTWADKDGQRRVAWECVADELSFVSSAKDEQSNEKTSFSREESSYLPDAYAAKETPSADEFEAVCDDDTLPF